MEGRSIDPNSGTIVLDDKLLVSQTPHLRSNESVSRIMLDVIIALTPAMIGSIYFFKFNALKLLLVSIISAVAFEAGIQKLFKKDIKVRDLSAVVTGILIAFNLPANAPWWIAVFGAGFAIIIVKEFFGGIGHNFMNPALGARAALVASWPGIMTNYINPDGISSATPLTVLKTGGGSLPSIQRMLIGDIGGVLGETSAILLLIGAVYLIVRKVIDWKIPVIYIASTCVMLAIFGVDANSILYHVLGGGLILGAFFMATDYATTPVTPIGRIIFAVGCGLLTALIRVKGSMPEGVSYSILIMNVFAPLIERWTQPKVFGEVK
ncbi:RnfABCDGE type electron transport complex subunit D [Paratissierella segnis]|jgi:electron transport complex protein RnfD|uniref:Ion-translocating oxidoreductase complex subunit D n=1 Tax=Paratissierella segnis TaxID=2763679 RepID=A0A926ILN9_9FIRM|nr:RnfABCDGE type electron transport complex subunit D [Paratissierella segnis]MBC8588853.1 RnfABCDGE type electron transport complex subunit D [Paratissierella segnis]